MNRRLLRLGIIVVLSVLFSFCSKKENGIYFNNDEVVESIYNQDHSKIEVELFENINKHRNSIGQLELGFLNIVSTIANKHTNYMIDKNEVSHDNFNQRVAFLMSNAAARSVAENVACGFNSSQGVLTGWLNSEAHRDIIENTNFTHLGVSVETNIEGRNYFTLILIRK